MKKIEAFEWQRILFGEAPPIFLIEVFLRGLLLYLFMIFIMRMLGKRMAGKLTVAELVLTITLGGSVAVAIQVPEGGVLIGFVVLTCALLFERLLSYLTTRSERFEKLAQGTTSTIIKDGVLQLNLMQDLRLTRQQIFAKLRAKKIRHLGEVERLYLEPGGTFSIYKIAGTSPPGITVLPHDDKNMINLQKKSKELKACANCGNTDPALREGSCSVCNSNDWTDAML
jgi:uncharacterized membrane protein YcaP (DUF421 family)